jgi:adenine-specific DNA-methyltransferase
MRLIGNKTKLLPQIEQLLRDRGHRGGVLIDIFTGSSAVARHFKERGYTVLANDLLSASHVSAIASVEADAPPGYQRVLRRRDMPDVRADLRRARRRTPGQSGGDLLALEMILSWLAREAPEVPGVMTRQYAPGGDAGRMYFRVSHARRMDAALQAIRCWLGEGDLSRVEAAVLVAAVLEAADRVANISGTYGAYLKSWQVNTEKDWDLKLPVITARRGGGRCRAFRRDANALVRRLRGEVLYLDPPYNHRQYAANYHVRDVIAEIAAITDPRALQEYEARLYGKTGLRPWKHQASAFCQGRGGPFKSPCYHAFRDLVLSARGRVAAVVVSYNEEGILSLEEISAVLAEFAESSRGFDARRDFLEISHKRFRSDTNHDGRRYRVLSGRRRDEVREWLFYAACPSVARRGRGRPKSLPSTARSI